MNQPKKKSGKKLFVKIILTLATLGLLLTTFLPVIALLLSKFG
jgi:hypothetical protein